MVWSFAAERPNMAVSAGWTQHRGFPALRLHETVGDRWYRCVMGSFRERLAYLTYSMFYRMLYASQYTLSHFTA